MKKNKYILWICKSSMLINRNYWFFTIFWSWLSWNRNDRIRFMGSHWCIRYWSKKK